MRLELWVVYWKWEFKAGAENIHVHVAFWPCQGLLIYNASGLLIDQPLAKGHSRAAYGFNSQLLLTSPDAGIKLPRSNYPVGLADARSRDLAGDQNFNLQYLDQGSDQEMMDVLCCWWINKRSRPENMEVGTTSFNQMYDAWHPRTGEPASLCYQRLHPQWNRCHPTVLD